MQVGSPPMLERVGMMFKQARLLVWRIVDPNLIRLPDMFVAYVVDPTVEFIIMNETPDGFAALR